MIRIFLKLFAFLLLLVIIIAAGFYAVQNLGNKISSVDVVTNDGLIYVSRQDLIDKVVSQDDEDWLNFNIKGLEDYIYSIHGVDYALVKKVWPATIVIYIYDREPLAYWNNNQVLLENMEIITPSVFNYANELPHIFSTDTNNKDYIYQMLQVLGDIAASHELSIDNIYYDGNQFSVGLSNGFMIRLGSKDLTSRFEKFFEYYPRVKDFNNVEYFDMRYENGFAVKYVNK